MSQHDMIIDNASGAGVRSDVNNGLQALASTSKGTSRPATAYAGQLWIDGDTPSSTVWTLNVYDGTNDIPVGTIDTVNNVFIPSCAGQVQGTSTNDNAAAGNIGEFVTSAVASGSAVNLTNNTPANITAISLTAGDWDVTGNIVFASGVSTVVTLLQGGISLTTAALPASPAGGYAIWSGSLTGVNQNGLPLIPSRLSLASTTTVYLVTVATFSTSTLAAYGSISARRAR
jgi:hypothetical protein